MPKVSIIVPVYNVEKYLDKCLTSLVNQTLKDIEIIVVNDGSPDNSQIIIDKYLKNYPGIIKSFKRKNGGLSDARNFGISKCNGEYIAFLDSDDYVDKDAYLKMYNYAQKGNFDMVVCDFYYDCDGKLKEGSSNILYDITNSDDIRKVFINNYPTVWNKIIKKDLFDNGIVFKKGVWFEDVEFIYRLLPYVNSIGVVKDNLIYYVQRNDSISKTFNKKLYDYVDNWNGIIDFYKKKDIYKEYEKEIEYSYVRYLYASFLKSCTNYNKKDYKKAVNIAIKNVKERFPGYRKNKYFYKSIKGLYLVLFSKPLAYLYYFLRRGIR